MLNKILWAFKPKVYCLWDEDLDFDYPAGTTDAGTLDTAIQNLMKGLCERLNVDHIFPEDNTTIDAADVGRHRKVTFDALASDPTAITSGAVAFSKQVSSKSELHLIDEDSNVIQLTSGGKLGSLTTDGLFDDVTITGTATFNGSLDIAVDVDIDGTLETDAITLGGVAVNVAGGLVTTANDGVVKVWANFSADGTVNDHLNVTSIAHDSTGNYTVTVDTNFASANYAVVASAYKDGATIYCCIGRAAASSILAGSFQVEVRNNAGTLTDPDVCCVIGIGDQ